jgi:hypothetical protein
MRRTFPLPFMLGEEPDPKPVGSLRFADPSAGEFPRHIHTFNDPHNKDAVGECHGIDSQTGALVSWDSRHTDKDTWAEMNKKRGVYEEKDD